MNMQELVPVISKSDSGCSLKCWIQPRASKTSIIGLHAGALKISLAAPPVDGEANAELCKFLAKKLNIAKSAVSISSGDSSRRKTVQIIGADVVAVIEKLNINL